MLGKMPYTATICIVLTLLQFATANEIENSKFEPVNLDHECVLKSGESQNEVPIILIHGMGMTKNNWNGVFETLAHQSGRRVCRVDLRNHGDSPRSKEVGVGAMSADVVHFLDEIGAEKAVIVGHSLGGKVAIHMALNYAERVESIVIEDITPNLSTISKDTVILFWKIFKMAMDTVPDGSDKTEAKKIIVDYIRHLTIQLQATLNDDQNYRLASFDCSDGKCHWIMNVDDIVDAIEKDFEKFWPPSVGTFEGPALFLYGTESPFQVGDHEENIKELFPNAKLVAFEGAGHSLHGYFPDFENQVLKLVKNA